MPKFCPCCKTDVPYTLDTFHNMPKGWVFVPFGKEQHLVCPACEAEPGKIEKWKWGEVYEEAEKKKDE